MNGVKSWYEAGLYKRLGGNATIQAKLSDNLTMSRMDSIRTSNGTDQKGWEMPMNCGGFCGHDFLHDATVKDGIITAATVEGTPVIENYREDDHVKQSSLAWDTRWDSHTGWKALARSQLVAHQSRRRSP